MFAAAATAAKLGLRREIARDDIFLIKNKQLI